MSRSANATRRVGRALATRVGILILATTLVLTAVAAWITAETPARQIQQDHAVLQATHLRNGFQSMSDMKRLVMVAQEVVANGGFNDRLRSDFVKAADILYVRKEHFRTVTGSDVAVESGQDAITWMEQMVATSDRALADPDYAPAALLDDLAYASERARENLVLFLDDVERLQRSVMREQSAVIEQQAWKVQTGLVVITLFGLTSLLFFRREFSARAELAKAKETADHLAFFDPLTALPNRAGFYRDAANHMRTARAVTLVLIDLDDFKAINDTYGHAAGDAVLASFGAVLGAAVAARNGCAGRMGGDEFAAMLPEIGPDEIDRFCTDLIEAVWTDHTSNEDLAQYGVTIGYALRPKRSDVRSTSIDDLSREADFALYAAKRDGRGSFRGYDKSLAATHAMQIALQEELPHAIEKGELTPYLQCKVSLPDRTVYGFEGLVRWIRHGRVISPDQFIDLAEACGMIEDIDIFVLRECTRHVAQHNSDHGTEYSISVNLSAEHFNSDRITRVVQEQLAACGLAPGLLTLELTETTAIKNKAIARGVITRLRAMGVRVALDDFGKGYSSLSLLNSIPVDELKIDRTLTAASARSQRSLTLLECIVRLARDLELDIVVEGIETQELEHTVLAVAVSRAQGFLYGMPEPLSDSLVGTSAETRKTA